MSPFDEDLSIRNGHYDIEIVIDRPIAQVWKQFLDIRSWVTSHDIEHIYGEPGTVGSITRVSFKGAKAEALPRPHHHYCKLITVVPEKRWLLKTYSEKGGSYGFGLRGFDDGQLFAMGDKTRVTFNLYIEYQSETFAKDTTLDLEASRNDVSRDGMVKNLENLKLILERQPHNASGQESKPPS